MLKISWRDKVTDASVLENVGEGRRMLNTIWQGTCRWLWHVLGNEVLV